MALRPYLTETSLIGEPGFKWDERKDAESRAKHRMPFALAQHAFADPKRVIAENMARTAKEEPHICFGKAGEGLLTVRYTYRAVVILTT